MKPIRTYFFACLLSLLVCLTAVGPSRAAICYVGGQTGSFAGTTSAQTINFSLTGGDVACDETAPQTDDLVIVTYGISATADFTLIIDAPDTTDYTLFGTEAIVSDLFDTNRRTAYRVMPSPTETQVVLSTSGTAGTGSVNNAGGYTIHVFRNVHATPLEQAVQQGSLTNTSAIAPGGITPTTAGTVVYVVGVGALGTGRQGVYTSGDLSGFLSSAQDDTNAVNIGAGYFEWTAGAFNPADFGGGGTPTADDSASWAIVALAPAAEVAGSASGSTCGAAMLLGVGGC